MVTNPNIFYERHLPHYHPYGYIFFITFRLAGSLPAVVVAQLQKERAKELEIISSFKNEKVKKEKYREYQSKYFGKFDKLLDSASHGHNWLKENKVARIVYDSILFRDKKEYELIAFTIMSNHVHIVFTPIAFSNLKETESSFNVTKIMQNLKKFTARECNKVLSREGSFWQNESYDHVVRNEKELNNIINYTLNNPVKAGLCEKWEDWKYNYFVGRFA